MSTIVYLDPDDGIASIKAKLEAARSDAVELVVPYGLLTLQNPVNARLLRRHIEYLGIRAIIVSRDGATRSVMQQEGLPARARVDAGPAMLAPDVVRSSKTFAAYMQERSDRSAKLRLWKTLGLVTVGAALVLPVLWAAMFLPSATVVLRPSLRPVDEIVTITASTLAGGVDVSSLTVPARVLEANFQVSGKLRTQTTRKEPEEKALDSVTFINRSDEPVRVPAGTRVGTASGIAFLTKESTLVPPNQPSGVLVSVVAANPGAIGNVSALAITQVLDALLASRLTVINQQPTSGGSNKESQIVGEGDYRRLQQQLLEAAHSQVARRLQEARPPGTSFYDESVRLRISKEESSNPIGAEAEELSLTLQGIGLVLGFAGKDTNQLLSRHFSKADPAYELSEGSLTIRPLEAVNYDNDVITFRAQVSATLRPRIDEGQLKEVIEGKTQAEAAALLAERVPLASWPQVQTGPFWVDKIPSLPWRITIRQIPSG